MSKPRLAIFDFACCEGCQLQIVNLEAEILDLLTVVEPVAWREAMTGESLSYDVAIVEGSITRPADEARLRAIRAEASTLVALGACATLGGLNKMRHAMPAKTALRHVYGADSGSPHLATGTVKAVHEVVPVDAEIHGCPIDPGELTATLKCLLMGCKPSVPKHPVCVECKRREIVCRYEFGEVCLGPLTRAGCGALCPANGAWCFGCRGAVPDANVPAAREVMEQYGRTARDLEDRLALFGTP